MKLKYSLPLIAIAFSTGMNAQNITNTLGSSGEFTVEDNSNNQLLTVKTSFGDPRIIIGEHGSLNPTRQFSIYQEGGTAGIELHSYLAGGFSSFNKIDMAHARGSFSSPSAIDFSDQLGSINWSAYTSSMLPSAALTVSVGESPQDASTGAVGVSRAPSHFTFTATSSAGSGNTHVFYVNGDGTIQIPALTSVSDLQTDANGVLIDGTSDSRLKTNINDLPYGLKEVMSLRPVTFNWTEESNMGEGLEHGFIAQEVAEIFPELVGQRNDGYFTVSYKELVPALTAAIQEQQGLISEQEMRLAALEERLTSLEQPKVQEASVKSYGLFLISIAAIGLLVFAVSKVRRA